ncbi:MAG: hypothetical protein BJ554DRAFT_1863 [Olpidium bornovanus]|uniref:Uncharacterized protein n=1 Tax=Olpidium bornovanus TaxID=278681 RepID=A0A8H8DGR9_9FUNG|nr:MAG: hypothetical protein BJ554DRAFT_1863 [Olpidium bornovanus]
MGKALQPVAGLLVVGGLGRVPCWPRASFAKHVRLSTPSPPPTFLSFSVRDKKKPEVDHIGHGNRGDRHIDLFVMEEHMKENFKKALGKAERVDVEWNSPRCVAQY